MTVCYYSSGQNISWLLATSTSNTSKSTRTPGSTQDPNIGLASATSSRDNVTCSMFGTLSDERSQPQHRPSHGLVHYQTTSEAEKEERQNVNQDALNQHDQDQ